MVRGRKVPVGTEARVFWAGADKYRNHRYDNPNRYLLADVMVLDAPERIGIETVDGEKFFTAAANVEVVQGCAS